MPKDTDASATLEAIDHLMAAQEQHGEILTHLERREVPDMQGLARRLEEVADAVERLKPAEVPKQRQWLVPVAAMLAFVFGMYACWFTIRWLPGAMLPPGFSRVIPTGQKGRF